MMQSTQGKKMQSQGEAKGLPTFRPLPFKCLQIAFGFTQVLSKWMFGVLVKRLFDEAFLLNQEESSNKLLDFVFLDGVSFQVVLVLAVMAAVLGAMTLSALLSKATLKAVYKSRAIRHKIVQQIVCIGDGAQVANDLLVALKVVEDFVANDEWRIFCMTFGLGLCLLLATIFLWYGGIIAFLVIVISESIGYVFHKLQEPHKTAVDANATLVNARLLDIVKNAVKIQIMGQNDYELQQLKQAEDEANEAVRKDIQCIFWRDFLKFIPLNMVFVGISSVAWKVIQATDETVTSVDLASAVFVVFALLDELHKNMIISSFVNDKKVIADAAQAKIDSFLGKTKTALNIEDHKALDKSDSTDATDLEGSGALDLSNHSTNFTRGFEQSEDFGSLFVNKISYAYPGREQNVFQNFSQEFKRGAVHGLVGESGSGKSTLLKIIGSLLTPDSGSIFHWKGMKIAFVSQDQTIFARSIRENVLYGSKLGSLNGSDSINKPSHDEEVWDALKAANLADWVETLPHGLDHVLAAGKDDISGGQLQRLNLAHLFCSCQDADFVVLDEVLSALDQDSRDHLIDQLGSFLKGKTAIIITHHSELLRICDEVHDLVPLQQQQQPE